MDLNPSGVGDGYPPYHPALGYPPAPAYHHTAGPVHYDGDAIYNNGLGIYSNGYHYTDYGRQTEQHRTELFPSDQQNMNGWHTHRPEGFKRSEISDVAMNNVEQSLCKRQYFSWQIQDSMYQYNTASWVCDLCQDNFKRSQDLNVHYYQYHINPHLISPADARLYRVSNFLVQTHEDPDIKSLFPASYRCHQCFNVFTLATALRIHLQKHNMPEPVSKKSPKPQTKLSDTLPISSKTKQSQGVKTPTKLKDSSDKAFETNFKSSPKVTKNGDKKTKIDLNKSFNNKSQTNKATTMSKDANSRSENQQNLETNNRVIKQKNSKLTLPVENKFKSKSEKMAIQHKHAKIKDGDSGHKFEDEISIEHKFNSNSEVIKPKSKSKESEALKVITKRKNVSSKANNDQSKYEAMKLMSQQKDSLKNKSEVKKVVAINDLKLNSEGSYKVSQSKESNSKVSNGIGFKHNSKALKKRKKCMAVTEKENFKRTKRLRRQHIGNTRLSETYDHDSFMDDTSSTETTQNKLNDVVIQDSGMSEVSESGRPRRKASSRIQQMRELGSETSDDFNSHSNQELAKRARRKRPQRECKDRTTTLVALSLAEQDYEKFDLDFERFKSDVNSPTPSEGSRIGSRAAGEVDAGQSVNAIEEDSVDIIEERDEKIKKKKVKPSGKNGNTKEKVNQPEKIKKKVGPEVEGNIKIVESLEKNSKKIQAEKSRKVENKKVKLLKKDVGTSKTAESFGENSGKLEEENFENIKKAQPVRKDAKIDGNIKKGELTSKTSEKFEEEISKKVRKKEKAKPSKDDSEKNEIIKKLEPFVKNGEKLEKENSKHMQNSVKSLKKEVKKKSVSLEQIDKMIEGKRLATIEESGTKIKKKKKRPFEVILSSEGEKLVKDGIVKTDSITQGEIKFAGMNIMEPGEKLLTKKSKKKFPINKDGNKKTIKSTNSKLKKKIRKLKTKKAKKAVGKKVAMKVKKVNEKSPAKMPKVRKKDNTRVKDMQEPVSPKKRVKTSKGWRPSITDTSKATNLVGSIVQQPSEFACISCHMCFPSYNHLHHHLVEGCVVKRDLRVPPIFHPKPPDLNQLHVSRYQEETSAEYSQYVTGSVVQVPEETFNNMHGQLSHLGTKDASTFAAHPLNEIGLVKLNYSGRWCVRNVWESLGWEPRNDQLSWQQYELATEVHKEQEKIAKEEVKKEVKSENTASHTSLVNGDCSELELAEIKTENETNDLNASKSKTEFSVDELEVNEAVAAVINGLIEATVTEASARSTPVGYLASGRTSPAPHCRPGPSLLQSVMSQLTSVVVSRQNPVITNKSVDRSLIHQLSHIPWNEQRMVKKAFDSTVTNRKQRKSSEILKPKSGGHVDSGHRQSGLPSKLGLKQVGKSVKYMKAQEREALGEKEKGPVNDVEIVKGQWNGEWEGEHRYLCTVCAEEYDDLQEVMHHKWESHPFCLVAHVTYSDANVTPPSLCYPQVQGTPSELLKRAKKPKINGHTNEKENHTCTKCGENFQSSYDFHIHILICSGIENWTSSPKKRKGKRGKTHGGGLKHVINNFNRRMQAKQESGGTDTDGESTPKKRTRPVREVIPAPVVPQHSRTTRLKENMKKVVKNLAAKERRKAKKDLNTKMAVNPIVQNDVSRQKVKRKINLDDNAATEEEIISDVLSEVISKIEMVENAKMLKPRRSSWITQKKEGRVNHLKRMNSVVSSESSTSSEDTTKEGLSDVKKRRRSMLRDRQDNIYKEASSSESSLDETAFKDKLWKEMEKDGLKNNLIKTRDKDRKSRETKIQVLNSTGTSSKKIENSKTTLSKESKMSNKSKSLDHSVVVNGKGNISNKNRKSESKGIKTSKMSSDKVISKKIKHKNNLGTGSLQKKGKKKPALSKVNTIQYDLIEKHVHDAVSSIIDDVATGKIEEIASERKPLIRTPSKAVPVQIKDDNNAEMVSDHARLTPKSAKKRSRSPSLERDRNIKLDDEKSSRPSSLERTKKAKSDDVNSNLSSLSGSKRKKFDNESSRSSSSGSVKKIILAEEHVNARSDNDKIAMVRPIKLNENDNDSQSIGKDSNPALKSPGKRSKSPSTDVIKKFKQDEEENKNRMKNDSSYKLEGDSIFAEEDIVAVNAWKSYSTLPKKVPEQPKRRQSFTKGNLHPNRIVFPLEVKISALERLEIGETQASVAKDLQIGLSTITKWWKNREDIMMQGASLVDEEGIDEIVEKKVGVIKGESENKLDGNNESSYPEVKSNEEGHMKDLIKQVHGRLSIPIEVKMSALLRVEGGETQSSVARDLQVGISTVACWWGKREAIRKRGTSTEGTENTENNVVCNDIMVHETKDIVGSIKNRNDGKEQTGLLKSDDKESEYTTVVAGKRKSFSLNIKLNAIDRIQNGEQQVTVARDLKVNVHTVAAWWNRREKILKKKNQILKNPHLVVNDSLNMTLDNEDKEHLAEELKKDENTNQDVSSTTKVVEQSDVSDEFLVKGLSPSEISKKILKKKKSKCSEVLQEPEIEKEGLIESQNISKTKNVSQASSNALTESQVTDKQIPSKESKKSTNEGHSNEEKTKGLIPKKVALTPEEDPVKIKKTSKKFQDFSPEVLTGSRDRRGSTSYTHSQQMPDSQGRLIMPIEVKQSAIRRILDGETKAQVARDLGCPLSTISTWWKKKGNILDSDELLKISQSQNNSSVIEQESINKLFKDVVSEGENKENDEVKVDETESNNKDLIENYEMMSIDAVEPSSSPNTHKSEVLTSMQEVTNEEENKKNEEDKLSVTEYIIKDFKESCEVIMKPTLEPPSSINSHKSEALDSMKNVIKKDKKNHDEIKFFETECNKRDLEICKSVIKDAVVLPAKISYNRIEAASSLKDQSNYTKKDLKENCENIMKVTAETSPSVNDQRSGALESIKDVTTTDEKKKNDETVFTQMNIEKSSEMEGSVETPPSMNTQRSEFLIPLKDEAKEVEKKDNVEIHKITLECHEKDLNCFNIIKADVEPLFSVHTTSNEVVEAMKNVTKDESKHNDEVKLDEMDIKENAAITIKNTVEPSYSEHCHKNEVLESTTKSFEDVLLEEKDLQELPIDVLKPLESDSPRCIGEVQNKIIGDINEPLKLKKQSDMSNFSSIIDALSKNTEDEIVSENSIQLRGLDNEKVEELITLEPCNSKTIGESIASNEMPADQKNLDVFISYQKTSNANENSCSNVESSSIDQIEHIQEIGEVEGNCDDGISKEVQSSEEKLYLENETVFVENVEKLYVEKENTIAEIEELKADEVSGHHIEKCWANEEKAEINKQDNEVLEMETNLKLEEKIYSNSSSIVFSDNSEKNQDMLVITSPDGVSKATTFAKPKKKSLDFLASKLLQKALAKSQTSVEVDEHTIKVDKPSEGLLSKSNSSDSTIMINFQEGALAKSKPSEGSTGQSASLDCVTAESSRSSDALNVHSVKISEILSIESETPSIRSMPELKKSFVAECSQTLNCSIVKSSNLADDSLANYRKNLANGSLANSSNNPVSGSLAKSNLKNTSSCPPAAESSNATGMTEDESTVKYELGINNHTTIHSVSDINIVDEAGKKTTFSSPLVTKPLPPSSLGGLGLLMNSYGSDDEDDDL